MHADHPSPLPRAPGILSSLASSSPRFLKWKARRSLPKRDLRNARFYPLDLKIEAFSAPQSYIDVANPAFMFGASGYRSASARNSQGVHHQAGFTAAVSFPIFE